MPTPVKVDELRAPSKAIVLQHGKVNVDDAVKRELEKVLKLREVMAKVRACIEMIGNFLETEDVANRIEKCLPVDEVSGVRSSVADRVHRVLERSSNVPPDILTLVNAIGVSALGSEFLENPSDFREKLQSLVYELLYQFHNRDSSRVSAVPEYVLRLTRARFEVRKMNMGNTWLDQEHILANICNSCSRFWPNVAGDGADMILDSRDGDSCVDDSELQATLKAYQDIRKTLSKSLQVYLDVLREFVDFTSLFGVDDDFEIVRKVVDMGDRIVACDSQNKRTVSALGDLVDFFEKIRLLFERVVRLEKFSNGANRLIDAMDGFDLPKFADIGSMWHPDDLMELVAHTLPATRDNFSRLAFANLKLRLMNAFDISERSHDVDEIGLCNRELTTRFDKFHSLGAREGNKIDTDVGTLYFARLIHGDPKPDDSRVSKLLRNEDYQRPEEDILDNLRFTLVLLPDVSAKIRDYVKEKMLNEGDFSAEDLDEIVREMPKEIIDNLVGALCYIFGTNFSTDRVKSSLVSGGTKLFSTGEHFALHITFNVKFNLQGRDASGRLLERFVQNLVEVQILLHQDEHTFKTDHEQYKRNRNDFFSYVYGLGVAFPDFIQTLIDALKFDILDKESNEFMFCRDTLLEFFTLRDAKGGLVNADVISGLLLSPFGKARLNAEFFARLATFVSHGSDMAKLLDKTRMEILNGAYPLTVVGSGGSHA